MTPKQGPRHVVVDGSNIATEGRSLPSLAQLSEAVASFMEEHPDTTITVVVDATFGHRIDKREAPEFEAGISNNELVAPPAGAIGRGDAFVLSIAQKAGASILSNDSFQEFHADYEWLFDEGRLIGGKPVPHVGWVFVNRSPVRGPVSRKAIQGAKLRGGTKRGARKAAAGSGSPLANEPMPVPKAPPPRKAVSGAESPSGAPADRAPAPSVASAPTPRAGEVVNELMPFLEFVEHHPIGTSVNGIVDAYSSHGAYISIGTDGVRGYIPLRLMSNPPPPSARKVMQIGEAVTVVVVSFAAARRSIDCAMPDMAAHAPVDTDPLATEPVEQPRTSRRGRGRKAAATPVEQTVEQIAPAALSEPEFVAAGLSTPANVPLTEAPAQKPPSRRGTAKKSAAATPTEATAVAADGQVAAKQMARKAPAGKAAAKKAPAKKAPAKKVAPAKKAPARKTAAKQSPATIAPASPDPVTTAPVGTAPTTSAPAQTAPAESPPAKRAAAKKPPAKTTAAKQTPSTKTPAKKAPAETTSAKTTSAKTTSAKTAPTKSTSAKTAPARKAATRKSSGAPTSPTIEPEGAS